LVPFTLADAWNYIQRFPPHLKIQFHCASLL
jgi:hypothetical protein